VNRTTGSLNNQRGAVAIIVALSLAVLLGMIGLALDLGRMFVIKSELQNAVDACALAAARELDGNSDALTRADAAGILTGTRNKINFQDAYAAIAAANITYSASLSPNSSYNRSISPSLAKYAMCSLSRPNIRMLFISVLGIGDRTVNAYAVATLAPGQTTCAVPIGVCAPNPASAPFGLVAGTWYKGKYGNKSGESLTGSYNWIDFSPPAGGTDELKDQLEGPGQCELPPVGACVGEQGQKVGATDAWNSRFGLYQHVSDVSNFPPDYTGLAYTVSGVGSAIATTWPNPPPQNAYDGTASSGTTVNYKTAALAHSTYQDDSHVPPDPADVISNGGKPSSVISGQLATYGQQRRIAITPIVNCGLLGSSTPGCGSQQVKILGYACILMLSPIKGPNDVVMEYLGDPNAANSPCGSYGLAGGGSGPLVPVLVQ
jgi:Flp pilus assembly protein TadG